MGITFHVVAAGQHGPTGYYEDPKLAAYTYAAHVQNVLRRPYDMKFHADGSITVRCCGLADATFAKQEEAVKL